ncbi:hypothetical protein NM688_g6303 [Phlebia brevispora]|uniref:Uncharacterized protein n=1 Tax=Phlebia brevispora TaxID=194682 RepID=A0ACC1SHK0_9APHY|nr:hypothetical protein NM688_g6303 [Phlebia brevispora]
MYKFIRRISNSFFSRPDRPWNEDATSNAPQIGQKRRHSSPEADDVPTPSSSKRQKTDFVDEEGAVEKNVLPQSQSLHEGTNGEGVKEVTKGVRDVELTERKDINGVAVNGAAAVPLPDSPVIGPQPEPVDLQVVAEVSAKTEGASTTKSLEGEEKSEKSEAEEAEAESMPTANHDKAASAESQVGADAPSSTGEAKDVKDVALEQVEPAVHEEKEFPSTLPAEEAETTADA